MTSPEKIAANRENARKSTGPKSSDGKARSSRNAVKHGLTARPEVHPGDPSEAFRESLAAWVDDLKPKGIVQKTLAERACRAAWSLKKCDRYEDATAAKRDRDAAEKHDIAETARAEAIGRRLIAGHAGPEDVAPSSLVDELRGTAAGVSWMLKRWGELARALKDPSGWDETRQFAAVRLLGLRPESARDHPLGRKILPPPLDLTANWARGSPFDEPAMRLVLEAVSGRGDGEPNPTQSECITDCGNDGARPKSASDPARLKALRALVRSQRTKLASLLTRTLKPRAASDRAGAADRSMFDESRSLALCLRYATAASRDLHRTIADLAKLRKATEDEDRDDEPDPPAPGPGPNPPPNSGANLRNKPNTESAPRQAPASVHTPQPETGLKVATPRPSHERVPTLRVGMPSCTLCVPRDVPKVPTRVDGRPDNSQEGFRSTCRRIKPAPTRPAKASEVGSGTGATMEPKSALLKLPPAFCGPLIMNQPVPGPNELTKLKFPEVPGWIPSNVEGDCQTSSERPNHAGSVVQPEAQ